MDLPVQDGHWAKFRHDRGIGKLGAGALGGA